MLGLPAGRQQPRGGVAWPHPTEVPPCAQLAMQFISQYSPEDIVTAHIEGSSGALWRISPPSRAQMKRELYNGTTDITLRFTWNFQRCVLHLGGAWAGCALQWVTLSPACRDRSKHGLSGSHSAGCSGSPAFLAHGVSTLTCNRRWQKPTWSD